jgi:hypothetical protein
MTRPGLNPGRRGGKPATNRLSYGADSLVSSYLNKPHVPNDENPFKISRIFQTYYNEIKLCKSCICFKKAYFLIC